MRTSMGLLCCFAFLALGLQAHEKAAHEDSAELPVFGAWEGSIPPQDLHSLGTDEPEEWLLYIRGQALRGEQSRPPEVNEVELQIHFSSGSTSTVRCWSPHDDLDLRSIDCQREISGHSPVHIMLKYWDAQRWSGLIEWRHTPVPITFERPQLALERRADHPFVGDWQSVGSSCYAQETFHIRLSRAGKIVVTYDRVDTLAASLGAPWDLSANQDEPKLMERTDGAFGGGRLFFPLLAANKSTISGRWVGHNALAGCTEFRRTQ